MSVSNPGEQDGSGSLGRMGGGLTSALKAAMKGAASRFTSCTFAMLEKPVRMTPPSCSMTWIALSGSFRGTRRAMILFYRSV